MTRSVPSIFASDDARVGYTASVWIKLAWSVFAGLTLVFLVAEWAGLPDVPLRTQALVYLIGMVLLNLPHGVIENWLNLGGRGFVFTASYISAFGLLGGTFAIFLTTSPATAVLLAIGVAMLKSGLGDMAARRVLTGSQHIPDGTLPNIPGVVARGGAVMVLPYMAHPETFDAFTGMMVGFLGSTGQLAPFLEVARLPVALTYILFLAIHLGLCVAGLWQSPQARYAALYDLGETVLIVAFFITVPVLIAVGLYFPFWYSTRQLARTIAVAGDAGTIQKSGFAGLAGLAVATAVGFGLFWAVFYDARINGMMTFNGVAIWTLFISTIAFPHVLIGGVADRERGLWRVDPVKSS